MYKTRVYVILAILAGFLFSCGEAPAGEKGSLTGFWHSTPSFSEGFKELYRFFDDGEVEYMGADGTLNRGNWELADDNVLKLEFFEPEEAAQNYSIEYAFSEEGAVATINGRKFWKLREPVDVINGIPLYIYFQPDDEKERQISKVIYVKHPHEGHRNAVFSYDGDLYDFKIVILSHRFDSDTDELHFYYEQDGIVFELKHLSPDVTVNYDNADIGSMYMEAFSFRDASGTYYAYAMTHGGRGGWMDGISKIKLK